MRKGEGVTFPFAPPYTDILQEVLNRSDLMVEHADNHFDSKRLRAAVFTLPTRIASSLWAFHFLQSDLRKGLGACAPFFCCIAPWKHLSSAEPAWYNAMDQVTAFDVWDGCKSRLIREGRWDTFMRHCVEVEPLLVRMGRAGIIRDDVKRDALKADLDAKCAEITRTIDAEVAEGVKKLKRWKNFPADVRAWCDAHGLETRKKKGQVQAEDLPLTEIKDATGVFRLGEGWARYEAFNPDSAPSGRVAHQVSWFEGSPDSER